MIAMSPWTEQAMAVLNYRHKESLPYFPTSFIEIKDAI